jgi:hypothetical protein
MLLGGGGAHLLSCFTPGSFLALRGGGALPDGVAVAISSIMALESVTRNGFLRAPYASVFVLLC